VKALKKHRGCGKTKKVSLPGGMGTYREETGYECQRIIWYQVNTISANDRQWKVKKKVETKVIRTKRVLLRGGVGG